MELVDTAGAHECLRGMRIVMLGDSTMTETMHDLVLLLAGLGSRPVEMADVIYKATRCMQPHAYYAVLRCSFSAERGSTD